jgi:hypothetical protein
VSDVVIVKDGAGKLRGARFGLLVVLRKTRHEAGRDWWLCLCDCGVEKEIIGKSLRAGLTKSCGCGVVRSARERKTTHGLWRHPLYKTWKNIGDRCRNPRNKHFKDYGGRGIVVLFDGPSDFILWALAAGWVPGLTIDRRDNDGPYSRDNCRIADAATQARNTRANRLVTVAGRSVCFKDACHLLGVNYHTAMSRLKRGQTSEAALGIGTS